LVSRRVFNEEGLLNVGEVSNNYYFNEGKAERFVKYNPKTNIIFCIREPVDLLLTIKTFADKRTLKIHAVEDCLQTPTVNIMGQAIPNSEKVEMQTRFFTPFSLIPT